MRASMPLKFGASLLAAAALAGCMQLAPRYERPPAPVPAAFPGFVADPVRVKANAEAIWSESKK